MISTAPDHLAREFLRLHEGPRGFVLPNAWDQASALIMAAEGFPAIATTSAGVALSLGKQDYRVTDAALAVGRSEMFERIRSIVAAVNLPVSADLEAGWGDAPEAVAQTIEMALAADLAGGNIEDKPAGADALYDEELAVARIAAAAGAIRRSGRAFVLNARTDLLQSATPDVDACIRRANRFLAAGATCVFTPGAADMETIRRLAREIGGPLNIVVGLGSAPTDIPAILDAGVKRVTLGGSMARAMMAFLQRAARELRTRASISFAADQLGGDELNALFAHARRPGRSAA